jgi:pSer/pThr/pTyr-binding forkhead associated (FHA) protein
MADTPGVTIRVLEPRPERRVEVRSKTLRIGSASDNDVVVDDPLVSEKHATLEVGSAIVVCDEASATGTFVNGERVSRRVLQRGDRIAIGATTLFVDSELWREDPDPTYRESAREPAPAPPPEEAPQSAAPRPGLWVRARPVLRYWPVVVALACVAGYLATYGLALPALDATFFEGLGLDTWPIPAPALLTASVGALFASVDAFVRTSAGDRTVLGRVCLVLGAIVALPVGLQVGLGLLSLGGMLLGAIMLVVMAAGGVVKLVHWIAGK